MLKRTLRTPHRAFPVALLTAAGLALAGPANAGAPAPALVKVLKSAARPAQAHPLADAKGRIGVTIPLPQGVSAESLGLLPAAPGVGGIRLDPEHLDAFASLHPDLAIHVAPPLRPLLDQSSKWIRAGDFRNETGATGKGVVVGIIDTGLDITHPDFQDAQHKTRVEWMMTLELPRGVHKELEDAFGCTDPNQQPCAIYSRDDINEILASGDPGNLRDFEGHGTHVTSIAAGNGGPTTGTKSPYVGIAPEATLVIVNALQANGGFDDLTILNSARFIFDRAEALGLPAVINMSVGGDFGAHDGTSDLEKGLSALVGDDKPGRAIVVAAGNSGSLFKVPDSPDPLGIHTEVHISDHEDVLVPIVSPAAEDGRGYVWITFQPDDEVSVGLDGPGGETWIRLTDPGTDRGYDQNGVTAGVINNIVNGKAPLTADTNGAVVAWQGKWGTAGKLNEINIRMRGHGDAQLWLTGLGDVSPSVSYGLLFKKAIKQGTITVPASSPSLLAVGCSVNRLEWPNVGGGGVQLGGLEGVEELGVDSTCFFSSAGPTPFGVPKPEITAPGGYVAAAMSDDADPRHVPGGLFDAPGCPPEAPFCYVVDARHAVTAGTSMSAPHVAGAIALLLQLSPNLTQAELTEILQAGARYPTGDVPYPVQLGAGALDLMGALAVMKEEPLIGAPPDVKKSWFVLSSDYARPDPAWPVWGTIELRRPDGSVASGLSGDLLELFVEGGVVTQPITKVRHGLFRFSVAGKKGEGLNTMRVTVAYNGEPLGNRALRIGNDVWSSAAIVQGVGGCSASIAGTDAGTDARTLAVPAGALVIAAAGIARAARARRRARSAGRERGGEES